MSLSDHSGRIISNLAGVPPTRSTGSTSNYEGDDLEKKDMRNATVPAVDPHKNARAIVRLIQCTQCSLPLRDPLILPCGNSLCRTCLPKLHNREHISFPATPVRKEGFICPFDSCGEDHSLGDCSQDIILAKIMDRVSIEVARRRPLVPDTPILLDERPHWKNIVDSSKEKRFPASRVLNGGRFLATYTLADIGELEYDSDVEYHSMSTIGDNYAHLDAMMLNQFKEAMTGELDCQVCCALMLDPLTTTCGHTFCRKCVARVLDHSTLCPVCRRSLPMPPKVEGLPGNSRLSGLLDGLCPDLVFARKEIAEQEEPIIQGERNVPLFVCTLAYPGIPTFLHIFEPRYRLMIRRAMETGGRKFGMLMYNLRGTEQGELGVTEFMEYGTMLHIHSFELLPDGRSLIECRGESRFRVKDWGMLDGYIVGNTQRIDDVSLAEEEQAEASETSRSPANVDDPRIQLDQMSTMELLRIGTDFIRRMQAASAPWLHERVLAAYGRPPNDAASFPFWFASILPIAEAEKYKLLATSSVRERLKITASWVQRLDAQRWSSASSCNIV